MEERLAYLGANSSSAARGTDGRYKLHVAWGHSGGSVRSDAGAAAHVARLRYIGVISRARGGSVAGPDKDRICVVKGRSKAALPIASALRAGVAAVVYKRSQIFGILFSAVAATGQHYTHGGCKESTWHSHRQNNILLPRNLGLFSGHLQAWQALIPVWKRLAVASFGREPLFS